MESFTREKQLYNAVIRGDIESLNKLLEEDPSVLDDYGSLTGFSLNGTPLHIAVTRRHLAFAKLLLQHRPELVNEVDFRLRAPLHLASANGVLEMVKLLLDVNSDACLAMDEFGRTPLHLAVMMNGTVEVVNVLVETRPEAIMMLLSNAKTVAILHSYVLRHGVEALKGLVKVDTFLSSQDEQDNTIVHRLSALKNHQMLEYLVPEMENHHIEKAKHKLTAHVSKTMRKHLAMYSALNNRKEKWFRKRTNAIMVVAALIAGMSYQAGLNPPGGIWEEDKKFTDINGEHRTVEAGNSIMADMFPDLYLPFWLCNEVSFFAALSLVLLLIHGSPCKSNGNWFRGIVRRAYVGLLTCILWITATAAALAYSYAILGMTPSRTEGFNPWVKTERTIQRAEIAWFALVLIVCLIKLWPCIKCVIKKSVKFIKRIWSTNENELHERQPQDNINDTSNCCVLA